MFEDDTGIFDQKWRYKIGWWQLSGLVPVTVVGNEAYSHIMARSPHGLTTECGLELDGDQWQIEFVAAMEMCEECTDEVGFEECPDKCGDAVCSGCGEEAYSHEYGLFCDIALAQMEEEE